MRVGQIAVDDKRLDRRVSTADRNRTSQRFRAWEPGAIVMGLNVEDGRQCLGILARLMDLHDHLTAVVQVDTEHIAHGRRAERQLTRR